MNIAVRILLLVSSIALFVSAQAVLQKLPDPPPAEPPRQEEPAKFAIPPALLPQQPKTKDERQEDLDALTEKRIKEASTADVGTFVVHLPAKGCPADWNPAPGIFENVDTGVKSDGCVRQFPNIQPIMMDYLRAREMLQLGFLLPLPLGPPPEEEKPGI